MVSLSSLLLAVSGCAWMYSAPVPLHTESYAAAAPAHASTLLVLMPGRGDSAGDWAAHGFISDLHAAGLSFDVVSTNATIGYVTRLADKGLEKAIADEPYIVSGVNTYKGTVPHKAVAEALGVPFAAFRSTT